jgi:hypothetical protein
MDDTSLVPPELFQRYLRNGPMQNITELGSIPIQSYMASNMWRTLKFYGNGNGIVGQEDYQILDHLRAGPRVRARVNINTTKENPQTGQGVLTSLLESATIASRNNAADFANYRTLKSISEESAPSRNLASAMASNIVAQGQAVGGYYSFAQFLSLNTNLFISDASLGDTDWQKESIIRSLANSISFRGEQFVIYGMGQSLREVHGTLEVTGEAYIQAIVDRVERTDQGGGLRVDYPYRYYRNLNR